MSYVPALALFVLGVFLLIGAPFLPAQAGSYLGKSVYCIGAKIPGIPYIYSGGCAGLSISMGVALALGTILLAIILLAVESFTAQVVSARQF